MDFVDFVEQQLQTEKSKQTATCVLDRWAGGEQEVSGAMESDCSWLHQIMWFSWLHDFSSKGHLKRSKQKQIRKLKAQIMVNLQPFLGSSLCNAANSVACFVSYHRLVAYVSSFLDDEAAREARWLTADLHDTTKDMLRQPVLDFATNVRNRFTLSRGAHASLELLQ